jgi:hypothetical protein
VGELAEATQRLGARVGRGHAAAHELLGAEVEVQRDLVVDVALAEGAPEGAEAHGEAEDAADAGAEGGRPHDVLGARVRMPVTASE